MSLFSSQAFSNWWRTIDRGLFTLIMLIIGCGAVLVMAASPAIAEHHNLPAFYFVQRQFFFMGLAICIIVALSTLSPVAVRRFAAIGFVVAMVCMVMVLFVGMEIKGARRWISLGSFSLQPSEFMKPFFVVMAGWILSRMPSAKSLKSYMVPAALYAVTAGLLVLQPDIGMTITLTTVFGIQLFLAGLPILYVVLAGLLGVGGFVAAYMGFSHVRERVDNFLKPEDSADNYQVEKSIEAFKSGGLFGRGPGEGIVKHQLPDSHTDFIFSVAGEELGIIICICIVLLFAAVLMRGCWRIYQQQDRFLLIATAGLLFVFGVQAFINMGVAVHILPAKGMTLPFISYGGSSMLASAVTIGLVMALTRRQIGISPELRFTA